MEGFTGFRPYQLCLRLICFSFLSRRRKSEIEAGRSINHRGCTKNCQGLKFKLISTPEECAKVFPSLLWAGALKDWDGPADGERPSAYVLVLEDLSIGKNLMWDEGIVSQTIMLSAVEKGYGGCMIGSCKRVEILEAVELDPQRYSLALVLALGKPKEEVRMVPVGEDGSTTYYRDENQVHYVPKRALEDILV